MQQCILSAWHVISQIQACWAKVSVSLNVRVCFPYLQFGIAESMVLLIVQEVARLVRLIQGDVNPQKLVSDTVASLPSLSRQLMLQWSDRVLAS